MHGDLEVMIFYPDGSPPEVLHCEASALSEKWKRFCQQMLDQLGPVFTQKLESTLSHFEIQMAGPLGRLIVHGKPCFEFWISCGCNTDQDQQIVGHLRQFLSKAWATVGQAVANETLSSITNIPSQPTLVMFDYCVFDVHENDKTAIAQLGFHLADAYLRYLDSPQLGERETTD